MRQRKLRLFVPELTVKMWAGPYRKMGPPKDPGEELSAEQEFSVVAEMEGESPVFRFSRKTTLEDVWQTLGEYWQ